MLTTVHGPAGAVTALAFAPGGRTLAAGGRDRTVHLWDLLDPERPLQLGRPIAAHDAPITAVSFGALGQTLATADAAGVVLLWDMDAPNKLRSRLNAVACSITRTGLDRADWQDRIPQLPYEGTCPGQT
jgi:WD40 repeat protein